ncbi:MAG: 50S ribosomal protein L15 [Treponema sp.]|nr:50S ribosomal protein L15 [Treponema sp.]
MAHDFNLHAPEGANKRRRILGRGQSSGRGTTAGKGSKGQKARSGGKTYVGFEGGQMPLYRRLAHRGFSNYPFKKTFQIVNLDEIDKRFNEGETVDEISLYDKGLVKGKKTNGAFSAAFPVKILGNGNLTKKLVFKIGAANGVNAISGSAREKIEKSGGEVASVDPSAGSTSAADLSAK